MKRASFAVLSLTAACTFGATGGGEASSGTTSAGDDATNGTSGSVETANDTADDGIDPASTSTGPSTTTMGVDVDSSDGTSTDTPTSGDTQSSTDGTTGSAALLANCAEVLAADDAAVDGVYTIDVDGEGGEDPFDVYCDMSTEGGGWTLVFAYGFASYDTFVTGANAVSVRPNWPITEDDPAPVSTTPPLGLDEEGAVDFDLWPDLGQSFMVRSNITNGIVCEELTGSLVSGMGGAIDCTLRGCDRHVYRRRADQRSLTDVRVRPARGYVVGLLGGRHVRALSDARPVRHQCWQPSDRSDRPLRRHPRAPLSGGVLDTKSGYSARTEAIEARAATVTSSRAPSNTNALSTTSPSPNSV